MAYSKPQLLLLAKNNPKELVRTLISPNANIQVLASGAEILGEEITDETVILPVFRQLLKHVHATVREGAAIGISSFYLERKPPADILQMLEVISVNDPSANIKDYVKTILEDFRKM